MMEEQKKGVLDPFKDTYERNKKAKDILVLAVETIDSLNENDIEKFQSYMQSYMDSEINLEVMRIEAMKTIEITDIINIELEKVEKKLSCSEICVEELEADTEKIYEYVEMVDKFIYSQEIIILDTFFMKER